MDESGTSGIPGNTSHFVLAGLSIPVEYWRECDAAVTSLKRQYNLEGMEIHVAWMMRAYREQDNIPDFATLDFSQRRAKVKSLRTTELYRLEKTKNHKLFKQTKINFKKTEPYTHLTRIERTNFIQDLAACVANWRYARLFAECIDKPFFVAQVRNKTVDEQAFEQIVSRFERYLQNISSPSGMRRGLLIHDNNQTVALRHTQMMKRFHASGTVWTNIQNIIETPLFVDSQLTSMIQIADLCSYSLRRYLENSETNLFDLLFPRADRARGVVVGVRHFTNQNCSCQICAYHRR